MNAAKTHISVCRIAWVSLAKFKHESTWQWFCDLREERTWEIE